jgi:hypothetical protein
MLRTIYYLGMKVQEMEAPSFVKIVFDHSLKMEFQMDSLFTRLGLEYSSEFSKKEFLTIELE